MKKIFLSIFLFISLFSEASAASKLSEELEDCYIIYNNLLSPQLVCGGEIKEIVFDPLLAAVIAGILLFSLLFRNPVAVIQHGIINVCGILAVYAATSIAGPRAGFNTSVIVMLVLVAVFYMADFELYYEWVNPDPRTGYIRDEDSPLWSKTGFFLTMIQFFLEWVSYALPALVKFSIFTRWEYLIFIFTWHLILAAIIFIFRR